MIQNLPDDLIFASFFFVDIVGLSDPVLSTETQRTKIRILNESIFSCNTFLSTPKENLYVLPTGDGMLIGFKDGLDESVRLAIELQEKISTYNSNAMDTEKIGIRIGCNDGHIFVVKDLFKNVNLWGPGAILARRVMDLGDENHILLTSSLAHDLIDISDYYEKILHPIHNYKIKHNEDIFLFSAYGENFGNPIPPKKITPTKANISDDEDILCEKIVFNLNILGNKNNFIRHKRSYYFSNKTDEPLYELKVGITTISEREFDNLNFKAFENNIAQKISKVFSHTSFSKEILIKLTPPIFPGEKTRILEVQYDEPLSINHFEHFFYAHSKSLEFNFVLPSRFIVEPKLYYMDTKLGFKKPLTNIQKTTKGDSAIFTWKENQVLHKSDMIRLEW